MLPELTAIGISLASVHIPYANQNQINPGIHLEMEDVRLGVYRNSNINNKLPHTTAYVGYSVPIYSTEGFRIGGNVAVAYGYRTPVIGGLELRFGSRLVVMVVPPVGISSVVAFAYRIPL
jgi:hypothetical protein